MGDWLPEDDIVHPIVDAVSLMDLSEFEAGHIEAALIVLN